MTENNKKNLSKAVAKLKDQILRKEFNDRIKSVKLNEIDSTVEYYLNDTKDKNRFKTAWMYVTE